MEAEHGEAVAALGDNVTKAAHAFIALREAEAALGDNVTKAAHVFIAHGAEP